MFINFIIGAVYTLAVLSIVVIASARGYWELIIPSIIALFAATTSLVMMMKSRKAD